MANSLDRITIKGFKSIRELKDFELSNLNILIGGNGAGKSNFIDVFRLLNNMVNSNLANFIQNRGGADGFLYNGPKVTERVKLHFEFGDNRYGFELSPAADERFMIDDEYKGYNSSRNTIINTGYESGLPAIKDERAYCNRTSPGIGHYVYDSIANWVVYHFHDTGATAPMRRSAIIEDKERLRSDASNIAPFLLGLKTKLLDKQKTKAYQEIVNAVRLVTPFFDDFILTPSRMGEAEKVKLMWKQKGSDYPMQPYHFSDGTIRFICLATALLQPNPPSTILIDEPELGLHPYAIEILAELIKSASATTQVIVSTQSPALVDNFEAEDIIVVNRKDGASTFERLDTQTLEIWLEDYSLGELWRKNVIAGGPVHE